MQASEQVGQLVQLVEAERHEEVHAPSHALYLQVGEFVVSLAHLCDGMVNVQPPLIFNKIAVLQQIGEIDDALLAQPEPLAVVDAIEMLQNSPVLRIIKRCHE